MASIGFAAACSGLLPPPVDRVARMFEATAVACCVGASVLELLVCVSAIPAAASAKARSRVG